MKSKRIMPLLLSAIMTVGTATAVPFTASAVEMNVPVVSAQSAKTSLATPKISKAESVYGGVKLTWSKVKGAEKYRVYYKGSKGWTRMVDTTSTSYIDKDVSSGKNYTYTVRCINSSATKFTSGYNGKGKSIKYVAAPEISKVESVNGGVKISWNKSNGAEKYRVYYKGSKGWTRLTDTTSTAYTDKAVSSGKNYTYTVRCISADAKRFTSGYNGKGKSIKYVAAPKISKTEATYNSVKISWNKVNGAEKYRVYYKSRKGWTRLADTTSTSYTDSKVSSGKTYTYTVRCINSSATKFTSGYDSKGVTVTTPVKPSVKPTKTTIKLDKTKVTLGAGEPCTLKATVSPSQKVTWTSSNPKLVKVDSNGKLTVTNDIFNYFEVEQTVKITAKAGNATATCTVTTNYERVYHKYAIVPVYKEEEVSVCKGCGRFIDYTVAPGTKYETEDGRKGVFIAKEEHNDHSYQHVLENKPGGWYSEVVMLKVGERVQHEGWYVD